MTHEPSGLPQFQQRFVLPDRRDEVEQAQRRVIAEIEKRGFEPATSFGIRLALEEALANAFRHGNRSDPGKTVRMECCIDASRVAIEIEDEGDGFDPQSVPDPTQEENLEIPSGRGLMLMRSFMTEVRIHPPGNRVSMMYTKRPKV